MKSLRKHFPLLIFLPFYIVHSASGFAPFKFQRIRRRTRGSSNRSCNGISLLSTPSDVFVVNWDGCIADTVDWRTQIGLQTALKVWPELADSVDGTDTTWIYNKIRALSHVLHEAEGKFSATCDYALITRLLLEEQQLDGGRSNNKSGKYASQFHPRETPPGEVSSGERGSRPLTVGEIGVNWNEGGMIRETLQVKYHAAFKDPLPILQSAVDEFLLKGSTTATPTLKPECLEALSKHDENLVIVTVGHVSEIQTVQACLSASGIETRVVDGPEEAVVAVNTTAILLKAKETVREIIESSSAETTIYVVDSSWHALQKEIPLFGDNIPRVAGIGKTIVPDRRLSLCLAKWAPSTHPTHESGATMNSWTNLIDLTEFSELISARITRR